MEHREFACWGSPGHCGMRRGGHAATPPPPAPCCSATSAAGGLSGPAEQQRAVPMQSATGAGPLCQHRRRRASAGAALRTAGWRRPSVGWGPALSAADSAANPFASCTASNRSSSSARGPALPEQALPQLPLRQPEALVSLGAFAARLGTFFTQQPELPAARAAADAVAAGDGRVVCVELTKGKRRVYRRRAGGSGAGGEGFEVLDDQVGGPGGRGAGDLASLLVCAAGCG